MNASVWLKFDNGRITIRKIGAVCLVSVCLESIDERKHHDFQGVTSQDCFERRRNAPGALPEARHVGLQKSGEIYETAA